MNKISIGTNSSIDSKELISGKNVKIGNNVQIKGQNIEIGSNCEIKDNVNINCDKLSLGDNCIINEFSSIQARNIQIGEQATISKFVTITGPGKGANKGLAEEFSIGDNAFIGDHTIISIPTFRAGDYCVLHHNMNVYDYCPVTMGHNCWFGQETIINSRRSVIMGNNVRVGMRSQIWTHSASGELIEGTQLFSEKEVIIEDDVWLNGTVIVAPGLRLSSYSVVMTGSVLTKSTERYHVYAGVPAKDITEKITPYITPSLEEKFNLMSKFIESFIDLFPHYQDKVFLVKNPNIIPSNIPDKNAIIFFKDANNIFKCKRNSVFDIKTKKYNKVRSQIEIDFIQTNLGHNARFIPIT